MKKTLSAEFVRQVENRLDAKRVEKEKRTVVVTKTTFKDFQKICKREGLFTSEVIDELIALYVELKGKPGG